MTAHAMDLHPTYRDQQRELPDALEAEQALLGALLIRNDLIEDVKWNFEARHFGEDLHRRMFEEMLKLRADGKTFSTITLKGALPAVDVGGMTVSQYMARLMADAVNFTGIKDWCEAITKACARRDAFETSSQLREIAFAEELRMPDQIQEIRSRLAEIVLSLEAEAASFSLADAIDASFDSTSDAMQGRGVDGIDPGVSEVLQLTGPWQKGQLIIIGGGVKQGKTALAMQCMFEIAKTAPVFLYSGEMTVKQLIMREQARRTGISQWQQQRGKVSPEEADQLLAAGREIKRSQHIEIDCRKMTLDQFGRKARAMKKEHGIGIAFADHLGKFQWNGKMQYEDEHKQAYIATSFLKDLAMELEIPIVALTHLKKNAFQDYQGRTLTERLKAVPNRRPTYRDLLGNMDKDADQVLIPFQPRPILAGMEPEEGSADYHVWQDLMSKWEGKAEIILSLSRESVFPRRQETDWDGKAMAYGAPYKRAQNDRRLL